MNIPIYVMILILLEEGVIKKKTSKKKFTKKTKTTKKRENRRQVEREEVQNPKNKLNYIKIKIFIYIL